jgi:ectoine hydroxylase-related dioxygenase (phytanoyl-CoA dioxygenase family)
VVSTPNELDRPLVVEAADVARFADQGFVRLKNVLSPETIARYEPEITLKVVQLNTMHLPLEERSTYNKAFLQVMNLWRHSDLVQELVFSRRLAQIASDLLGVDDVRLYHDQALYKEPGGGVTPWHADQYYWPLSSDRVCTVWIPLQPTPIDMGPLEFAASSQRFYFGRDIPISDESEARLQQVLAEQNFEVVSGAYELGEVSYHLGWTFHHAQPNRSQSPRRVMTVIYMDAAIAVTEPANEFQRNDLEHWMPGTPIGSVPRSPLNPVL